MKKLNYTLFGSGTKTIVLLHYFGGNEESWHWTIKRLKKRYAVVAITLPGFGNTEALEEPSIFGFANYINSCIQDLKLENYILCGHSMSGKLILYADQIALTYKAKALILIAPSPPTVEKMSAEDKEKMLELDTRDAAAENVANATFRKLRKRKLEVAITSQLQVDSDTWSWWLKEGMNDDISERIPGLDTPTFVICAKKDPIIPMAEIYDTVLPFLHKPRLIQLGRCGHLVPLEAPRKLSKRLLKIADNILE